MESPERHVRQWLGERLISPAGKSTTADQRFGSAAPGSSAVAPHRPSGEHDMARIDLVTAFDLFQDLQGAVGVGRAGLPARQQATMVSSHCGKMTMKGNVAARCLT